MDSENGLIDILVDVVVKLTTNIKLTEQTNFIEFLEMDSVAQLLNLEANTKKN